MLQALTIQNIALIEREEIAFSPGLNILSGETGAGKSIVLDAIDFVLGAKAERSLIRHGAQECSVRAVFSCDAGPVRDALSELDLPVEDELILSRKFSSEGKSSIRINGEAVTLTMLKKITPLLVDIHGQSEHFSLLKESNQLALLDKAAGTGLSALKEELALHLSEKRDILADIGAIGGDEAERARRMDILRYQIDEIERGALKEGEEEELLARRALLQNAEKILGNLSEAHFALRGEGGWGAVDAVTAAKRAIDAAARFDERCRALSDRLDGILAELSDVEEEISSLLDSSEFDEGDLEHLENRLDEIKTLKRKYGGSVAAAIDFQRQAREEYTKLANSEEELLALNARLADCNRNIFRLCCRMSELRRRAAEKLSDAVTEELKDLNIRSARFEITFSPYTEEDTDRATSLGLDGIEFLFSANAGEPLKALGKIISGGELSRFMLAVKAISASDIGTCIFDEIDAGIGGRTAVAVAEKFAKIARHTQVIAVSHLAQVVAYADRHLLITKEECDGKTQTHVNVIEGEARRSELARMISGGESALSLQQAEEMLRLAQTRKDELT